MKYSLNSLIKKFAAFLILILFSQSIFAQITRDSISLDDLKAFSYDFSLENGQLEGPGATILRDAIIEAQFTMLGDNRASKLEQQFTTALINELDKSNYKNMVLEAGIGTDAIINKLAEHRERIPQEIKSFNQKYALHKNDRVFIPVLEFRSVEGAQFFQQAVNHDWNFLTLGAAPWTSYKMFSDLLFANLTSEDQKIHRPLFEQVQTELDIQYEKIQAHNSKEVKVFIAGLRSTGTLQKFLDEMESFTANKDAIEGFKYSIDYWEMYGEGKFYQKNMDSAKKDKFQLAQKLKQINFDFTNEKLFVKMWRNHLGKGHSLAGTFGVGNMLLEMAEAHGNKSLTIAFIERFSDKEGVIKDILETKDAFSERYQEFVQLGKKEEWVLIDLRSFNEKFYYGPYTMSTAVYKMLARYDLLIIPKTDCSATPNY